MDILRGRIGSGRVTVLCSALVCISVFTVYSLTLTHIHEMDALIYAGQVEKGDIPSLMHPHHLAYLPLARLLYSGWLLLGWTRGALLPMQILSVLTASLGATFFYLTLSELGVPHLIAVAGAFGLALSKVYWAFAVAASMYAPAMLFLILTFWGLVRYLGHPDFKSVLLIAVGHGLGVLLHQSYALLFPIILLFLLLRRPPDRSRLHLISVYSVSLGALVGIPYLLGGVVVLRCCTPAAMFRWLTLYATVGSRRSRVEALTRWSAFLPLERWKEAVLASGWGTLATLKQILGGGAVDLSALALAMPIAGLYALLSIALIAGVIKAWRISPLLGGVLIAWVAAFGGFAWWLIGLPKFYAPVLIPTWTFVSLGCGQVGAGGTGTRWQRLFRASPLLLIAFFCGFINLTVGETPDLYWASGNLCTLNSIALNRDVRNDPLYQFAAGIARGTNPGDMIITPPGKISLYLARYFDRRNARSLTQELDWAKTARASVWYEADFDSASVHPVTQEVITGFEAAAEDALDRGNLVLVNTEEWRFLRALEDWPKMEELLVEYFLCEDILLPYDSPLTVSGRGMSDLGFVELRRK